MHQTETSDLLAGFVPFKGGQSHRSVDLRINITGPRVLSNAPLARLLAARGGQFDILIDPTKKRIAMLASAEGRCHARTCSSPTYLTGIKSACRQIGLGDGLYEVEDVDGYLIFGAGK